MKILSTARHEARHLAFARTASRLVFAIAVAASMPAIAIRNGVRSVTPTGEFVWSEVDVDLPGNGIGLRIERTYQSRHEFKGSLGYAWGFNLDQHITVDDITNDIVVSTGNTGSIRFAAYGPHAVDPGFDGELLLVSQGCAAPANCDYWQLVAGDGTTRHFDSKGNLRAISNRAGYEIDLTWSQQWISDPLYQGCTYKSGNWQESLCEHMDSYWRLDSVSDTMGRTVYFEYLNPDHPDRVDCLTLNAANGCFGALVSYVYDYDWSSTTNGSSAIENPGLLTQALDANGFGNRYEYDHVDAVRFDTVLNEDSAVPIATDNVERVCNDFCRGVPANSIAPACDGIIQCGQHCNHGEDHVCYLPDIGDPDICYNKCQVYLLDPSNQYPDPLQQAPKRYGTNNDLGGNLARVVNADNVVVVENTYGEVVTDPSWDAVTVQRIGGLSTATYPTDETTLQWSYFDLLHGSLAVFPPDTTGMVQSATDFQPRTVCECAAGTAFGYCDTYRDLSDAIAQYTPTRAIVATGLRGTQITEYVDKDGQILRTVDHHVTDGESSTIGDEETDFNYDARQRLVGTRTASGIRTCQSYDPDFGNPVQTTVIPASAALGEAPLISRNDYDNHWNPNGHGLLTDTTVDTTGRAIHSHFTYDSQGQVIEQDEDVGPGAQVATIFTYWPGWAIPATTEIHGKAGGSMGPVTRAVNLSNTDWISNTQSPLPVITRLGTNWSNAPVSHVRYDNLGRVTESGGGDLGAARRLLRYSYDAAGRLLTRSYLFDPQDTAETTSFWYFESWTYPVIATHLPWPVSVSDATSRHGLQYDVNGRVISDVAWPTVQITNDTSQSTATCAYYDLQDGRLLRALRPEGELVELIYDDEGRLLREKRSAKSSYSGPDYFWAGYVCPGNVNAAEHQETAEAVRQYRYAPGGLVSWKKEGGIETFVTRDGFGRSIEERDLAGNVTRRGYDSTGEVRWEARLGASASPYSPTVAGNLADPWLVALVEYQYDLAGRLTQKRVHNLPTMFGGTTSPDVVTTITYDDMLGAVTTQTGGAVVVTQTDTAGRVTRKDLPANAGFTNSVTIAWQSDLENTVSTIVAARTQTTHNVSDGSSASTTWVDTLDGGAGNWSHAETDRRGRPILHMSGSFAQLDHETLSYDAFGRPLVRTALSESMSPKSITHWDRDGRVASIVDGNGGQHQFAYDALDRRVKHWGPDYSGSGDPYHVATFQYEPESSRISQVTDGAGTTQSIAYWPGTGLTRTITTTDGYTDYPGRITTQTFAYDAGGRMLTAAVTNPDYANAVQFWPDALGDISVEMNDSLGGLFVEHDSFDPFGKPLTTRVGGATITNTYYPDERLSNVAIDASTPQISLSYSGLGGPRQVLATAFDGSGGIIGSYDYDVLGHLRSLSVAQQGTEFTVPLASFGWSRDRDGNVVERSYLFGNEQSTWQPIYDAFATDATRRVTGENLAIHDVYSWQDSSHFATPNDGAQYTSASWAASHGTTWTNGLRGYQYDLADNWSHRSSGDGSLSYWTAYDVSYTRNNEITGYPQSVGTQPPAPPVHNLATGNVESDPSIGSFRWDGLGLLEAATPLASIDLKYQYDALGRRIKEIAPDGTVTFYVWDGARLAATAEANTADPTTPYSSSIRIMVDGDGIDRHLAVYRPASTDSAADLKMLFQAEDASVLAVTDGATLVEGYQYSAFGETTVVDGSGSPTSPTAGNPFGFQGHIYDERLGTYSMRNREYDPRTGRFLSNDPIGISGGLNTFSFTGGSPLTLRDPSGLKTIVVDTSSVFPGSEVRIDGPEDATCAVKDGHLHCDSPSNGEFTWFDGGVLGRGSHTDWALGPPPPPNSLRGSFSFFGDPLPESYQRPLARKLYTAHRPLGTFTIAAPFAAPAAAIVAVTGLGGARALAAIVGWFGTHPGELNIIEEEIEQAGNGAEEAASAFTTLYRAVSPEEFEQVMKEGVFAMGKGSMEGKWFAERAGDAVKWGESFGGTFRVLEVQVPSEIAEQMYYRSNLDQIGPARYGELVQLVGSIIKEYRP